MPSIKDMSMPCPYDICDGSGVNGTDEYGEPIECLCRTDEEMKEVY